MLKSTIVQAATAPKDETEVRKINYRQTNARWIAMGLGCLVLFGQQYCFDNPSALEETIMENLAHAGKEISVVTFNLLYILYSLPNVVICIFGGALIDKFKARTILVLTIILLTAGQTVFTFGGFKNIFWIMLTGRIIFGVAAETLTASQNTLISNWFKPNQLSLILGISISFPKLGSALNNYISPMLAKKYHGEEGYKNVWVPLAVGLGVALLSIGFAIALFLMDYKTDKKEDVTYQESVKASKNVAYTPEKKRERKYVSTSSIKVEEVENLLDEQPTKKKEGGEHISFADIKKLPLTFWLLLLVCMFSEALFIPFLDNGNTYFSTIYGIPSDEAGTYLILPYCICALITPFFGCVIDRIAKRALVIVISCVAFVVTYGVMMVFERVDDLPKGVIILPLVLLGICCAVYCTAIVPSVPMLVDRKLLGTAFGLMEMLQNLALGTFPLISAAIRDSYPKGKEKEGFESQTLFYLGISGLCLLCSIALLVRDKMTDQKLYRKDFQREYAKTVLQGDFEENES